MFSGFSEDMKKFYEDLKENNSKAWFDENRARYDEVVRSSKEFVLQWGERLKELRPEVKAIPQVNKSLFRINRDTRFSKNKDPYKTNLGVFIWEGNRDKRMECSGFYFHYEAGESFVGVGMHEFPKDVLDRFRKVTENDLKSSELLDIIDTINGMEDVEVGGKSLKRIPKGYAVNDFNEELLKYKGLFGWKKLDENIIFSDNLIDVLIKECEEMMPLHEFIVENMLS